jgi:hypothetical protein
MVSSFIIMALDEQNRILALKKGKGFAILRGVTEWEDDSDEATVRREVSEEAYVTLDFVAHAAVIETMPEDSFTGKPVVTLVMAGRVKSLNPYPPQEKHRRAFLSKPDFLKHCAADNPEVCPQLLDMVEKAVK